MFISLLVALSVFSQICSADYHNVGASVQLFEWSWEDIANECETFLSVKGFKSVQVKFHSIFYRLLVNQHFRIIDISSYGSYHGIAVVDSLPGDKLFEYVTLRIVLQILPFF